MNFSNTVLGWSAAIRLHLRWGPSDVHKPSLPVKRKWLNSRHHQYGGHFEQPLAAEPPT